MKRAPQGSACQTRSVGLLILFVFVALLLALGARSRRRTRRAWAGVADEFGLSHIVRGGSPEMTGVHANGRIAVTTHSQEVDDTVHWTTSYKVSHPSVGPAVRLTKRRKPSILRRLAGRAGPQSHEDSFDDQVAVESDHHAEVRQFLTPSRQAAVLSVFNRYKFAEITDESIAVSTSGIETKADSMRATLRLLIDVAAVMVDSEAVDELLAQQQAGDLRDAAQGLRELNQQQPNAFTKQLEGEAWTEIGDHQSAAVIFDELGDLLPHDAEVKNWSRVAHTPTTPAPSPPPHPAPTGTGQQAVIDDLFDPARMSWEIVEHFEATYQHQPVAWSGEVTTFGRYRHDSDFGEGPGIKATVLLGTVGRSTIMSSEVHAILELPEFAELVRGTRISFAGVLTTVDRFSRKLQVRSARLDDG